MRGLKIGPRWSRTRSLPCVPPFVELHPFLSSLIVSQRLLFSPPPRPSLHSPSSLRHPYLSLTGLALSSRVSLNLMGSKGKIEIFLTRCLLPSHVVPTAFSDSFPSSIWLMGAGEIEQGTAYLTPPRPTWPHLSSIHRTPR